MGNEQRRFLKRPALNQSQLKEGRRTGALAMKVGMMGIFNQWGEKVPTTVLHMDECEVLSQITEDRHGYTALQLGVGEAKSNRVGVCDMGQFKAASVLAGRDIKAKRKVAEFRVTPDCLLPEGTRLSALHFVAGQKVDVCGISKGKGFQGVMKRWNFSGGNATHGNSLSHRVAGSTGQCQDPGKVLKGKKMAGRMGSERITVQNLTIVKIDPAKNLIYVLGAVPGNAGVFVRVVDAVKGPFYPSPPPYPTYLPETIGETWEDLQFKESVFYPIKSPEERGEYTEPVDAY